MHITVIGLNYKTAPVEIRERVTFDAQQVAEAMRALQQKKTIYENVLISTCNRTEVYAVVDQPRAGAHYIKEFLAEWFDLEINQFSKHVYIYDDTRAIDHLFNVACGLDSMVLGETQILGQVKDGFAIAQDVKSTGTIFNRLFKQVITFAKKAHTKTAINTKAVSISYAAVELAKKQFNTLQDKQVLVFGAGEMGLLAIENLYGSGAQNVTVINRSFAKAEEAARKFRGTARRIEELSLSLTQADILISSTGANGAVITKEMMEPIVTLREGRPIMIIDIAVPRDVEAAVGELDNVHLYDIDDLQGIVQSNLAERQLAAAEIRTLIGDEIAEFEAWSDMLGVVPIISALKIKAGTIQGETMKSLERKLPNLSEREWKVINKHVRSMMNQMLKDPILFAKESSDRMVTKHALNAFMKIFNIEELVEEEKHARAEKQLQMEQPELEHVH